MSRTLWIPLLSMAICVLNCSQVVDGQPAVSDPSPGLQFDPNTLSRCAAIGDGCQWLVSECSSNAKCAKWYDCLLRCPVGEYLQACVQRCDASAQELTIDVQRVKNCLFDPDSQMCSDNIQQLGVAGTGDRWGFNKYSDASVSGAGAAGFAPPFDGNPCAACLPDCLRIGCNGDELCFILKRSLESCSATQSEAHWQACLLEADSDPKVSAAHTTFAQQGGMKCVLRQCGSVCVPQQQPRCINCLSDASTCGELFDQYLLSASAQNLQWCQTQCTLVGQDGGRPDTIDACQTASCRNSYPEGVELLDSLVACRYAFCGEPCSGML